MRVIKFRAWDNNHKALHYSDDAGIDWLLDTVERHGGFVEQFTGSLDIAGKEIYEGDLVTGKFPYAKKCLVVWDKKRCGFYLKPVDGLGKAAQDKYYKINSCKVLIVGNIHESRKI